MKYGKTFTLFYKEGKILFDGILHTLRLLLHGLPFSDQQQGIFYPQTG